VPDSPALRELRARLDAGLSRRPRLALDRSDLVSAAVLVPITERDGRPHLLFTKKSDSVPHHKGQFSFPGGIVEQRDASRVEAALREAWEEIRLPAEAVEVLGLLDDTETRATSFIITPVVGIVTERVDFVPDGREILAGVHRLRFDTGAWFAGRGQPGFYPEVTVVFEVTDPAEHHHVPLLLSPYGYTTYRGS